jgi:hypothetical protein
VLNQLVERSDQSTDQQNEAEGEYEAECSKLGVITGSRRAPSVEELNQRREKRSQAKKQNPELEETPHSLSIERTTMLCCSLKICSSSLFFIYQLDGPMESTEILLPDTESRSWLAILIISRGGSRRVELRMKVSSDAT